MKLSEEILEKIHTAGYVVFYIITLPGFRLSRHNVLFTFMHLSMSSRRGGRWGIGLDFDRSLWPGGRAFE